MNRLHFLRTIGILSTALFVAPTEVLSRQVVEKMPDFGSLLVKENFIKYCRWLCRNGKHHFWMILDPLQEKDTTQAWWQAYIIMHKGKVHIGGIIDDHANKPPFYIDFEKLHMDKSVKGLAHIHWVNTVTLPEDMVTEHAMQKERYEKRFRLSIDKIHTI